MSENVRFYQQKMAEKRAACRVDHPLAHQLREILVHVAECEWWWAVEDHAKRRLDRD